MENKKEEVRVDKWLWSVRLFKTRNKAQLACKNGNVFINGKSCKASKMVKLENRITIKSGSYEKEVLVKGIISKRVSAKIAVDLYEIIQR